MVAAQKSATEGQLKALSAQFLDAVSGMAPDQIIGYVLAGRNDRRAVTAANLADMLEIVHDGALLFVVVEDGREQALPAHALKALRVAVKARSRLDRLSPSLTAGAVIQGETSQPMPAAPNYTPPLLTQSPAPASELDILVRGVVNDIALGLRILLWIVSVSVAAGLTVAFISAFAETFFR